MNVKHSDDHHEQLNLNDDIIIHEVTSTEPGRQAAQRSAPHHITTLNGAVGDRARYVVPPAMPRGKIQIRRIQNPSSRQVTFCKRRHGLLKKAREISILCDAHVAVIIFSATGRLYHFCNTSMEQILERYKRSNIGKFDRPHLAHSVEYWKEEAARRRSKLKTMQDALRHLMGEDLGLLPLKEIENLESHLKEAMDRVRSRQIKLLMGQLQGLNEQFQAQSLVEENDMLKAEVSSNNLNSGDVGDAGRAAKGPAVLA